MTSYLCIVRLRPLCAAVGTKSARRELADIRRPCIRLVDFPVRALSANVPAASVHHACGARPLPWSSLATFAITFSPPAAQKGPRTMRRWESLTAPIIRPTRTSSDSRGMLRDVAFHGLSTLLRDQPHTLLCFASEASPVVPKSTPSVAKSSGFQNRS